jgi:LmbE family N-acetylglucosaminyl deacetylase
MPGPVILGCFAHPDDEQFGKAGALMCATRDGAAVHILCATRGQAGQISDPALATRETLGAVREQELREAIALAGWESPILLDYIDGQLHLVDRDELRDAVVAHIRRLRPAIVITFDRNGGYGHLDHIAIHHATLAAVDAAADPSHRPDLGAAHTVAKVYFSAYPRSLWVGMSDLFVEHGFPPIDFGDVQSIPTEEIGTEDGRVTTVVDVPAEFIERRVRAMLAHRTQFGAAGPWASIPAAAFGRLLDHDHFVRHHPAPAPDAVLPDETDLLAGLSGDAR